jgi:hypothetical protein
VSKLLHPAFLWYTSTGGSDTQPLGHPHRKLVVTDMVYITSYIVADRFLSYQDTQCLDPTIARTVGFEPTPNSFGDCCATVTPCANVEQFSSLLRLGNTTFRKDGTYLMTVPKSSSPGRDRTYDNPLNRRALCL